MKKAVLLLVSALFLSATAWALQHSDLSPRAQELVPKVRGVNLVLKDGSKVYGLVAMDTADKVILKVKKPGMRLPVSRKFLRSELLSACKKQLDKPAVDEILEELGLAPTSRAEELGVEAMLALCETVRHRLQRR